MITIPAMVTNQSWFDRKNRPKAEAVKPRKRKTVDSPITKNSADSMTRRRPAASSCISDMLIPPM